MSTTNEVCIWEDNNQNIYLWWKCCFHIQLSTESKIKEFNQSKCEKKIHTVIILKPYTITTPTKSHSKTFCTVKFVHMIEKIEYWKKNPA